MPPRSIDEFEVGWVCALPKELTASRAMFDEEYESFEDMKDSRRNSTYGMDHNSYILGRIGGQNVVMACLPAGMYGTNAAAAVANNMWRTFPKLRFGLMVGIGGGIPNLEANSDIRLGDVVVSQPEKTHPGVVQYDLGKRMGHSIFERKGTLRPPPTELLTALSNLQSRNDLDGHRLPKFLTQAFERHPKLAEQGYSHPGAGSDTLYCSHSKQISGNTSCNRCQGGVLQRKARKEQNPVIHYGVIASGNEVISDAEERDKLSKELGAKCVEMEAAGLMNEFPCLVVRGICDYADAYKNDVWQKYSAITAAAFAKDLLLVLKPGRVAISLPFRPVLKSQWKEEFALGLNLFDAPNIGADLFVGRSTESQEMLDVLQPEDKTAEQRVLILGGMGGVGKTQIVINYAKQQRNLYSAIFWLNATSEATLKASFRMIARRVIPAATAGTFEDDQLRSKVLNWLSETNNFHWLLIFDNHDDPDAYPIQKYYPFAAQGSIIITTRLPDRLNGRQIKLQSMQELKDSLRVLATRSGRREAETDHGALKLVQRLGGYPLALVTAGSFLKHNQLTFAEYLEQYELRWRVSYRRLRTLPEYSDKTLYNTWQLSLTQVKDEDPVVVQLLMLLAYFDVSNITYDLLHAGLSKSSPEWYKEIASSPVDFASAMSFLSEYCFVEIRPHSKAYSIHVCVHDWLLNGIETTLDEQKERYAIAFECVAQSVLGHIWDEFAGTKYSQITAHARKLGYSKFENLLNDNKHLVDNEDRAETMVELLRLQGFLAEGTVIAERIVAKREKENGLDDEGTLAMTNNLGLLYHYDDRLDKAEKMFDRAIIGNEKVLGVDHISSIKTFDNMALLYRRQGRLEEAEKMFEKAIAGMEKLKPARGLQYQTINNLGTVYDDQNKLDKAEEMYNKAYEGKKRELGEDHHSTLLSLNNLGIIYRRQRRFEEAEGLFQRSLAGCERSLGPYHSITLTSVSSMAWLYWEQDRLEEAEAQCDRAMNNFERMSKKTARDLLTIVERLADRHADEGRFDDAERLCRRAVECSQELYGHEGGPMDDDFQILLKDIADRRQKEEKEYVILDASETKEAEPPQATQVVGEEPESESKGKEASSVKHTERKDSPVEASQHDPFKQSDRPITHSITW